MFIRQKKNSSGSVSVQIIKKIGRCNKILKTIGCSNDAEEIKKLQKQAEHDILRLFGPTLFDSLSKPIVSELTNDDLRVVGPNLIFGPVYDKIGFSIIKEPLLKELAISRITHPGSKLRLSEYLRDTGKMDLSVYSIYRFLDKLNKKFKSKVEEISFNYTKQILEGDVGVVFYDMTTIYFESSQPDELRMPGFSKDGKHSNPQIFLGLLVGNNGYPIGYDIFEGKTFEGHTLIPILKQFEFRFSLKRPIVVADSGLLNKDNILDLVKNGYKFIIGARIKNESLTITNKINQHKRHNGMNVEINKPDGNRLIINYSDNRAKSDAINRERGLKRLEKSINAGKLTKENINNKGYNKYLQLVGETKISIDYKKYEEDSKWDGLKGYVTNTDLPCEEVIRTYTNLWNIEKAFRISKTDLQIRPIYHRLRDRIEAHICVSFMSYLLYKELDRVLKKNNSKITINKAIEQINRMQEITTTKKGVSKTIIRLKNNNTQQEILDIITKEF
jgi:transposase